MCLQFNGEAQYIVKSKLPHYLYPEYKEYYLSNEHITSPLVSRVRYKPTPPEWEKYKPTTNRIQNSEGFELINITNGNNAQSETWIAINPNNPLNIIATANDNKYLGGLDNWRMSSWATFDGGQTWKHAITPANGGLYISAPKDGSMTIFDPGVAFDADGNATYIYGYTQVLNNDLDGENGVFAVGSTNGGIDWNAFGKDEPISAVALSTNETPQPFHDRYSVACDFMSNTSFRNRIYVTWQRFKSNPGVALSYSTNKGRSWTNPKLIGLGTSTQAPMPATGPDGEVYVAWINNLYPTNESQAIVTKSTNGGVTFGNTIIAQRVFSVGTRNAQSGRFTLEKKQGIRVSSPPQIAVDCSNKPSRGYVYVVQAGREVDNGEYRVFVSRSTNGGSTWQRVRVDNNQLGNDMFFPSITVDPITGTVAVLYYSSQNDPNNVGVDAYISVSNDAGLTWNPIRVSPSTWYLNSAQTVFPQQGVGNVYWGDYTSITSYNGVIYPLFWMPTASNYSFFSLDLFTAPISNNPQPVKDLTGISVVDSKTKIKLSWTNPTMDLMKNPLGDFNVLIYRNDNPNNSIGSVNKSQTPEFIDENVVDGTNYTYTLKVETTDKRTSVPVTVSVLAGGALKPLAPENIVWRPLDNSVKLSWTNPSKSIDGSQIRDLYKIKVYNSKNTLIKEVDVNQSLAGQYFETTIDLGSEKFEKIYLTSVAKRGDKTEESDKTQSLVVYQGVVRPTISENFDGESLIPMFTENGWVKTTRTFQTAPNSFASTDKDRYETNMSYDLILPPLVVSEASQSIIFDHICLVHSTDVAQLSISKDFGKTWKGTRWYDVTSSTSFIRGDLANSKWVQTAADLRPYIGDTILIRFELISGGALVDIGWFIDNVVTNNVVSVEQDALPSVDINIFPNPVSNNLNISLNITKTGIYSIGIYDLLGNSVKSFGSQLINSFKNELNFDVSAIPSGSYIIKIESSDKTLVKPVIISR